MAANSCSIAKHPRQPVSIGSALNLPASNNVGAIISGQRYAVASCEGGGCILPAREAHNG
jgi:hypothetical protein